MGRGRRALGDTAERLAASSRWEYGDLPYWGGEVDCCINAFTLANGAWLGVDVAPLAGWFLEHRMRDGGWNCEWENGTTVSSFHSTLNAIIGLLDYEAATGDDSVREARHAGEAYLLERRLLRRRSTGELVAPWADRFAYPFRWIYSALKATDHFRRGGHPRRVAAGSAARGGDRGRPRRARRAGPLAAGPSASRVRSGSRSTRMPGEPSKWLTLHALRVLDWWDTSA